VSSATNRPLTSSLPLLGLLGLPPLYAQTGLRITVERARIPRPGEPGALTKTEQSRVERAAARRGVRDRAIVAVAGCVDNAIRVRRVTAW